MNAPVDALDLVRKAIELTQRKQALNELVDETYAEIASIDREIALLEEAAADLSKRPSPEPAPERKTKAKPEPAPGPSSSPRKRPAPRGPMPTGSATRKGYSDRVRAAVEKLGEASVADVATIAGLEHKQTSIILARLCSQGEVRRTAPGVYASA